MELMVEMEMQEVQEILDHLDLLDKEEYLVQLEIVALLENRGQLALQVFVV